MHLIALEEADHALKEIARLFVGAMVDWPTDNRVHIGRCVQEFKAWFGDPFTFDQDGRIRVVEGATSADWAWSIFSYWEKSARPSRWSCFEDRQIPMTANGPFPYFISVPTTAST